MISCSYLQVPQWYIAASPSTIVLFVSRFREKRLPNALNVNVNVMYYVSLNRDRTVNVHLNWSILSRLSFFVYYISPHSINLPRCKNIFFNLWIKAMSPKLGGAGRMGWKESFHVHYDLVITHRIKRCTQTYKLLTLTHTDGCLHACSEVSNYETPQLLLIVRINNNHLLYE